MSAGMDCARPQMPCAWLQAHSWISAAHDRMVAVLSGPTSSKRTGNVSLNTRPSRTRHRECHSGTSRTSAGGSSSSASASPASLASAAIARSGARETRDEDAKSGEVDGWLPRMAVRAVVVARGLTARCAVAGASAEVIDTRRVNLGGRSVDVRRSCAVQ